MLDFKISMQSMVLDWTCKWVWFNLIDDLDYGLGWWIELRIVWSRLGRGDGNWLGLVTISDFLALLSVWGLEFMASFRIMMWMIGSNGWIWIMMSGWEC